MEYNTKRDALIIPEYGRHVQKMVQYATQLQDETEKKKCVNAIIAFMGQMNPHLRDIPDFTHKLWDHLFIMSGFKLIVESPYPIPEKEKLNMRPQKMPYPKTNIKYPFYGINIQRMITYACSMPEGELQDIMTGMIANNMKKSYLNWSKASVDQHTIYNHLKDLSEGKLKLHVDFQLLDEKDIPKNKPFKNGKKKGQRYKNFKKSNGYI